MRHLASLSLALLLVANNARAEQRGWSRFPPLVSEALEALRNSDHGLGDQITMNLDGPRTGRTVGDERSYNFDASRHLSWILADLNGDARPEVFLLIEHGGGSDAPWGVVMHKARSGWRIACEYQHEAWLSSGNSPVSFLDRRTRGWRHFRVLDGTYGWRHVPEAGGIYCVRLVARPTRLLDPPRP